MIYKHECVIILETVIISLYIIGHWEVIIWVLQCVNSVNCFINGTELVNWGDILMVKALDS